MGGAAAVQCLSKQGDTYALMHVACFPSEKWRSREGQGNHEKGVDGKVQCWIIPEGAGLVPSQEFKRGIERRLSPS